MGRYHNPDGSIVDVDDDYAATLGLTPVTAGEQEQRDISGGRELLGEERGVLGTINAGATSFLSGATLGLSDVALAGVLSDDQRERLYAEREANPGISTAGNIAGAITSAVVAPESLGGKLPGARLAGWANEGVEAGRAIGGIGGAARVAAYSGAEAAAQSAGGYLSDVALGDRELTAEGMAGAVGRGFAFGAAAGGALYGIERGAIAARRMFPRTGAAKAAELAETELSTKGAQIIDAGDRTAEIAEQQLAAMQSELAGVRSQLDEARRTPGGMPLDASDIKVDGAVTTVRAKDLEARGFSQLPGVGDDAVKMTKARKAIAEGQREPIEVTVGADGALDVPDGRHRLQAAIEADAPVTVRWRRGAGPEAVTESLPVQATKEAAGDVVTKQAAAPPITQATLETQLAEMQAKLSGGASLQDLNAARLTPAKAVEVREALTEYKQARQSVDEWVERIRNPRVEHHGINYEHPTNASAGFGRIKRVLDTDVPVEQSGGQIRIIGAKENPLEALTPNSRLIGADVVPDRQLGRALDEEYHDLIDMARRADIPEDRALALQEAAGIENEIHRLARGKRPEVDAVLDRIDALRQQHGRSGITSAEKRLRNLQERYEKAGEAHALPLPDQQPAIPRQPTRRPDLPADAIAKPPSFVDEAAKAAEVIGQYEKAAAKLTDAVGDAAPTEAKAARDGLRQAESEADRKLVDRTTRAVDDHAEGVAPKRRGKKPADEAPAAKPPRPKSDHQLEMERIRRETAEANLATARTRKADAEAATAERHAKRAEAENTKAAGARAENATKAADTVGLPEAASGGEGRLGKIADVASIAELVDGIPGMPKIRDLPIVGPLLSMYLKYRGLKTIAGRMTGRIPATADAKAAALAAKTKDRAVQAVDRLLGLAERTAPAARKVVVPAGGALTAALAHRYHDDGDTLAKDAPLPLLAAARARELAAAVSDPQSVVRRVRAELHEVADPDLIAAAEQFELRKIQYLHDHAPKEPPSGPLTKRQWQPSMGESMKFARRAEIADDPIKAFEAVERRSITPEQAETLRALYPKLFITCQERLVERMADVAQTVPRDQRYRMSLLFDVPLDRLMEPDTLSLLQSSANATSSPAAPTPAQSSPMPSIAGPVDLTALYTTPSDRRAARR